MIVAGKGDENCQERRESVISDIMISAEYRLPLAHVGVGVPDNDRCNFLGTSCRRLAGVKAIHVQPRQREYREKNAPVGHNRGIRGKEATCNQISI